ncbi:hypothetical protein A3F06_03105 [candidate division TM6 bacterium RIFCSPHIGHO2_12_FULL_36_22]|nr:MAG: hypothetical protein A3F06_03105 [candidate division TM6 bacterium RIFCSPHIGHO2_12_FULL_36_22]
MHNVVVGGLYRHYKGKLYKVINIARHSETLEFMVIYQALYNSTFGNNTIWTRPLTMFVEEIDLQTHQQRFELISKPSNLLRK